MSGTGDTSMLTVTGAASAHNNPSPAQQSPVTTHCEGQQSGERGHCSAAYCRQCDDQLQSSSLQSFMLHTAHHVMTSSVFPHVGSLQTFMLQCCMLQCDGQLSTTGQHVSGCVHPGHVTRDMWPQHSLRGGSFQWLVSNLVLGLAAVRGKSGRRWLARCQYVTTHTLH